MGVQHQLYIIGLTLMDLDKGCFQNTLQLIEDTEMIEEQKACDI